MLSVTHETDGRRAVRERAIGRSLLLLTVGMIALATLVPSEGAESASLTPLTCLVCGDFGAVDVALNTALFLPFGLALGLIRVRWRRVVVTALLVTVAIELLQLTLILGRDASLSDLLTNTAGGAFGAWIAPHWRRLLIPDIRTARTLFAALVLAWALARLCTTWLLRPAFPDTRWYGQVAPADVYPATFGGTVLRGGFGAVSARTGDMPELHAAFSAPEIVVRALVAGAPPTRGLASVLSVLDEQQSEVVVLGQEGEAARLRFRLRAADLRFRTPSVRLEGAIVDAGGAPVELVGRIRPGSLSLSSTSTAQSTAATLMLGPGIGWALLVPFDVGLTPAAAAAWTSACTAVVVLILAFFANRAMPHRPLVAMGVTLAAAAVSLWLPLTVFPEATIAATEALAALAGAMLGTALGDGRRAVS